MYSVKYSCKNCGWRGTLNFAHGNTAPSTMICPNCGCFDALKVWPRESCSLSPRPKFVPYPKLPYKHPKLDWVGFITSCCL